MKKIFIILGLISALAATILAVTKFFNLAILPIIIAFVCGLLLIFISRKEQTKIKPVQYIFLLVIISLSITIYKSVTTSSHVENTNQLEQTDQDSINKSKELIDSTEIDVKI